jgi:hypothetical protein
METLLSEMFLINSQSVHVPRTNYKETIKLKIISINRQLCFEYYPYFELHYKTHKGWQPNTIIEY